MIIVIIFTAAVAAVAMHCFVEILWPKEQKEQKLQKIERKKNSNNIVSYNRIVCNF